MRTLAHGFQSLQPMDDPRRYANDQISGYAPPCASRCRCRWQSCGRSGLRQHGRHRPCAISPKDLVLVHGAFCGSWIWRRVADQLEQDGHKVFVPTLTGLGERSHLLRKDVDLDTHIADVVNLIKSESLENVWLVSWSYAGFVGSGALESIGDRVSSIVWLDAFLPGNGHRVVDFTAFGKAAQTASDKGEIGFGPSGKLAAVFVAERDRASPSPRSLRSRSTRICSRSSCRGRSTG